MVRGWSPFRALSLPTSTLASAGALACLLASGEARAEPKSGKAEPEPLPPAAEVHLSVSPSPSGSWTMVVSNGGKSPVRIVADARLLWLEVVPAPGPPPAKPRHGLHAVAHVPGKMASCRAPAELRGAGEEAERSLVLRPGERYEEAFDPMLLCGASKLMAGLKSGAVVYPHLGYPDPPHARHRKAKSEPTLPPPPYIVESLKDPRDIAPVRHLEATPFVLYTPPPEPPAPASAESKPGESKPGESKPGESKPGESKPGESKPDAAKPGDSKPAEVVDERAPRLEITSTRLSDASSGAEVVVEVTVANRGKRAALVHLRSDDVAFDLRTPGGRVMRCDAGNDRRAAARDFFESLGPGSKRHFAIRLRELCPVDAFARPGVYEATARVELTDEGERYHLDALVTQAAADEPSRIRVRTGRLRYHLTPPAALAPPGAPGATPDGE